MSKKYEKPSIIGPIQCLKGTTGFQWNEPPVRSTIQMAGLKKKVAGAKLRKEDFGGLVLNTETDQVFEVNHPGFDIISWSQEDTTVEDLATKLAKSYGIDEQTAALDLNEFLLSAYRRL